MATLTLTGRALILGTAPGAVARQLAGAELTLAEAGPLRDEISTDEITPLPTLLHFDGALARFPHTGTVIGGDRPIGEGALADAGVQVIVAGKRYGKGSSREHAPLAEYMAGVRLILAESFERIYRQNCDNIGLVTSTDLTLLDRLRAGEAIALDEILADRDPLARAILKAGGLLAYGKAHLRGADPVRVATDAPMTLAEKILSRNLLSVEGRAPDLSPGAGRFVSADLRFMHDIYTAMAAHLLHDRFGDDLTLHDPGSIVMFEDHYSYAHRSPNYVSPGVLPQVERLGREHRAFVVRHGLTHHGRLQGEEGSEGISHAVIAERHALPGQLIAGTDSHTTHSGALGAFAFGVGTTDMCNAFVTGAVRLTVPETLLVALTGTVPEGVTAKDIMLALLAAPKVRAGAAVGRVVEFAGPALAALSIDERATLTNMVAEMGGVAGICAPDDETRRFLKERRGIDVEIAQWMRSDPGATYAERLSLDCSGLGPMLARPGDPGNGVALADLGAEIRIDIAYGGSCTAGKRADFDQYHAVAAWARDNGLCVAEGVTLYLQCGTVEVRDYCRDRGYLDTFRAIGAEVLGPACGACAQCGPGVSTRPDQVTVSAINRNFPGRGGPGQVWLASPPTVVASAILGRIASFAELKAARS